MPTRRQFLKAGLAGAASLAAVKVLYDRMHRDPDGVVRAPPLRDDAREIIEALVPVVLAGALPAEARARDEARAAASAGVLGAIRGLPPAAQGELDELFALLAFAPTRVLVAGLRSPWRVAPPEDLAAFLERWRNSRFELLQSGYHALNQLILASWYADPRSWQAIGYAGPPRLSG
jgi:hypothetical protein